MPEQNKPISTKNKKLPARTLVTIFITLTTIAMLPSILSTAPARNAIMSRVNDKVDGTISVASWSLGWFKGISFEDIRYKNNKLDMTARIGKVSISSGILKLLPKNKDLGTVTISEPVIAMAIMTAQNPRKQTEKPASAYATRSGADERQQRSGNATADKSSIQQPASEPKPFKGDIKAQIDIKGGRIELRRKGEEEHFDVNNIDIELSVAGLDKPILIFMSATQGQGKGRLEAEGSIKLMEIGIFNADTMTGRLKVKTDNFNLGPLGEAISSLPSMPRFTGNMTSEAICDIKGINTINAHGQIMLSSMRLAGGFLGKDKPSLERILLRFSMEKDDRLINIERCDLESPLANISVTGSIDPFSETRYHPASLVGKATVHVAELTAQLPHTLKIKKDLTITRGKLIIASALESSPAVMTIACTVKTDNIAAKQGDRILALSKPINMSAKGTITENRLSLDKLDLSSSFARAKGKGNLDQLQLAIAADLDVASRELEKFIEMDNLKLAGKLSLTASMTSVSDRSRKLGVSGEITSLHLAGLTAKPVSEALVTLKTDGLLDLDKQNKFKGISSAQVNISSKTFTLAGSLAGFKLGKKGAPPALTGLKLKASGDIGAIQNIIREEGTNNVDLGGLFSFDCEGSIKEGIADLSTAKVNIRNFFVDNGKNRVAEPSVTVSAAARADFPKDIITLTDLELTSSPLNLACSGTYSNLKKTKNLKLGGSWKCDFKRISEIVSGFTALDLEMEGAKPQNFSIETSLAGKTLLDYLKSTTAEAGLYMKRFNLMGIEAKEITPTLRITNSIATISLDTTVNEGRFIFNPTLDGTGKQAVATLPKDSQLLTKVKVNSAMASKLLSNFHPIFKGCIITAGRMNMKMDKCFVPLDKTLKKDTTFAGEMTLTDLDLMPGGLFKQLMDLTRLRGTKIGVPDQVTTFVCKNGQVNPSPLVFKLGEHTLTLSSNVGLDGKARISAELPVTEGMVGPELYKFAKGMTIRLPVEGPLSNLSVSSSTFTGLLRGMQKDLALKLATEEGKQAIKDLLGDDAPDSLQQGVEQGLNLLEGFLNKKKK